MAEKPSFSEGRYLEQFTALPDGGQLERALDHFLAHVGDLAGPNIHRRIKLNHLRYGAHILTNQTAGKHGVEKLTRRLHALDKHPRPDPSCRLFRLVDARDTGEHAGFPGRYLKLGEDLAQFRHRLEGLDLQPFIKRDFDAGLAALNGRLDYRLDDIVNLDVANEELALAVSCAVLEHVIDYEAVYDWPFRRIKPGTVQFHFVDPVDHRSCRGDARYDAWSFLIEGGRSAQRQSPARFGAPCCLGKSGLRGRGISAKGRKYFN